MCFLFCFALTPSAWHCTVGPVVLPACCINLHSIQAVTEVISLGLATTVLPAAIAGAIFQVRRYRGRFQGLIKPAKKHTKGHLRAHTQDKWVIWRFHCKQPTHSHGAADSVVQAAHVVHWAAVGGVVKHGCRKEAEVVRCPGNIHSPCSCYRFTYKDSEVSIKGQVKQLPTHFWDRVQD